MNGWERWGKRFAKGLLWAPVYFGGAYGAGLQPSMPLLLLVVGCGFWANILDAALPTDSQALPSTQSGGAAK